MAAVVNHSVSPGTAATRRRASEWALVTAAAVALAIVMTWPVAGRLSTAGRVDHTDGMYALWNVAWVARALTSDPLGVFDANIFYPHKRTLAYSESNIGAGALGVPAWLLTRDVYATYNSVVLIGFALSFICTYALVRRLTGNRLSAAVAAIGFAYAPYVYARFPHIQLQMTFGIPLALLAFHRVVERPTISRGAGLGAALAVAALSSAYYGVLVGLAVAGGAVYYAGWFGLWRNSPYWMAVTAALGTLALLMLPFVPPYLELREAGFERTLQDARQFTVNWWGWLASPATLHRWLLHADSRGVAFPGIAPVIGGAAGFALAIWSRQHLPSVSRTHGVFYLLLGTLAFWLSFGPQAGLYTLLHHALPVFGFLRAVERFSILVTLALCVGLGFAVAYAARRWPAGRFRRPAIVALLALMIAGSWIAPLYYPKAKPVPNVYRALARAPHGAVAEFPFFLRPVNLNRHAHYMLFSTYHWKPLVNGYSDFYPADYLGMLGELTMFPSAPESFDHLRARDTKYVIMHLHWYAEPRQAQVRQGLEHYVAQGVLRRFGKDVAREADGTVKYDVEAYEILRYP